MASRLSLGLVVAGTIALGVIATIAFQSEKAARTAYESWLVFRGSEHEAELARLLESGDRTALNAAAEAGDPNAQAALGLLLCSEGNVEESLPWFEQAADASHPPSMLYLLMLSGPGENARADIAEIARWAYRIKLIGRFFSPELDEATEAFVRTPCLESVGREAGVWFAAGVLHGPPDYVGLADGYERTDGLSHDNVELYALTTAALWKMDVSSTRWAEPELTARIERLEAEMTPAEIEAAQPRARDWLRL